LSKIIDRQFVPREVARTRGDLAIPQRPQLAAHRGLAERDAELFPYPLRQIRQTPAHHLVDRRYRAALDDLGQGLTLRVIELGPVARRLAVDQPRRAPRIEAQRPVADGLRPDPADPRRIGAGPPVIDLRQREKPPRLRGVLRALREPSKSRPVEIIS